MKEGVDGYGESTNSHAFNTQRTLWVCPTHSLNTHSSQIRYPLPSYPFFSLLSHFLLFVFCLHFFISFSLKSYLHLFLSLFKITLILIYPNITFRYSFQLILFKFHLNSIPLFSLFMIFFVGFIKMMS